MTEVMTKTKKLVIHGCRFGCTSSSDVQGASATIDQLIEALDQRKRIKIFSESFVSASSSETYQNVSYEKAVEILKNAYQEIHKKDGQLFSIQFVPSYISSSSWTIVWHKVY